MSRQENRNEKSNIIIYTTEDGLTKIETTFDEDTVWLSIDQMAELFQRDRSVIGKQPTLKEAVLAKNYLDEKELRAMGQLVSGYLDFAERQAEREQAMTMKDWADHLDRILTMSGEQLLVGNGSITHEQAVDKATKEYRKYKEKTLSEVEQDYLDVIKLLEQKTDIK